MTLTAVIKFFHRTTGFWCCITTPCLVTKCSAVRFERYHPGKHTLTFWITAVTLTINALIHIFHRTLWLMMQYDQTKFGCKWTSSLVDIVRNSHILIIYTLAVTLTLKIVNQFFHMKHRLTVWTFAVTLTLNAVIPFFHTTLRLMMLHYQTKLGCKLTSSLEDTTERATFWLYKPLLWPWHWR